jgi:hypothetical protein
MMEAFYLRFPYEREYSPFQYFFTAIFLAYPHTRTYIIIALTIYVQAFHALVRPGVKSGFTIF